MSKTEIIREFMAMLNDKTLVRNTDHDPDYAYFLRQSIRITNTVSAANNVLSDCPADFTNLLRQDKYEHQPIQQPTETIN